MTTAELGEYFNLLLAVGATCLLAGLFVFGAIGLVQVYRSA